MKTAMKKLFGILIVMAMLFSFIPIATSATSTDVVILFTNDVHSYIDNGSDDGFRYSQVASLKDYYADSNAGALLLDAGDFLQGSIYGSHDKGLSIIDIMNATGYDAVTLGNHEFDYGMDGCQAAVAAATFPALSANFRKADGTLVLQPYKIFTFGEYKIGVVGITTPESITKSTPKYFQNDAGEYIYSIDGGTDGQALYTSVQAAINSAKNDGADFIVALGHLGTDEVSAPWRSTDVMNNTTGIDVFIDGHSHSTVNGETVNGGKLFSTGSYLSKVGMVKIGTTTSEALEVKEHALLETFPSNVIRPDGTVAGKENAHIDVVNASLATIVGKLEVTLDNYDEANNRLVRKQETNSGDFAADALVYLFSEMEHKADCAIMNGGGVRNRAITGEVSYADLKQIHAFGNVACLIKVTGQQILDALEWGARANPGEQGGFLHVSGITYDILNNIPSTVQYDADGVWTGGPTGGYRVHNVKINDEPLDLNKKYNLAGYNYTLRLQGDGFAMFDGAENILDYVMTDFMVLANYFNNFEDNTVTDGNSVYGDLNGAGRINIYANSTGKIEITIPELNEETDLTKLVDETETSEGVAEEVYVLDEKDETVEQLKPGGKYTIEFKIKIDNGKGVKDTEQITVNGNPASFDFDAGVLTVNYTFNIAPDNTSDSTVIVWISLLLISAAAITILGKKKVTGK